MNENERDDRARLRLSLRPSMNERLNEVADALDIDRNAVALFCMSLGLRSLYVSYVNPMGSKSVVDAVEKQVDSEIAGTYADAGIQK